MQPDAKETQLALSFLQEVAFYRPDGLLGTVGLKRPPLS